MSGIRVRYADRKHFAIKPTFSQMQAFEKKYLQIFFSRISRYLRRKEILQLAAKRALSLGLVSVIYHDELVRCRVVNNSKFLPAVNTWVPTGQYCNRK